MKIFKDLYAYRELLKTNVKKEIRGKYKGSFLGIIWSFLNPLLMTLVYAIVFPYLLRGANYDHYTTFLIIGILPWNWWDYKKSILSTRNITDIRCYKWFNKLLDYMCNNVYILNL